MSKTIKVKKSEMLKEHVNLIDVLLTGSFAKRKKEAAKQKKELKEYK